MTQQLIVLVVVDVGIVVLVPVALWHACRPAVHVGGRRHRPGHRPASTPRPAPGCHADGVPAAYLIEHTRETTRDVLFPAYTGGTR